MFSLVIADDLAMIRQGLEAYIAARYSNIDILRVCKDGREVMSVLEETVVDILITDIRMPIYSGLELAEYIHVNKLNTQVVMISAYSEFEYAREAMHYGVGAYLLKPIEPLQLCAALDQAIDNVVEERKIQRIRNNAGQADVFVENYRSALSAYIDGGYSIEHLTRIGAAGGWLQMVSDYDYYLLDIYRESDMFRQQAERSALPGNLIEIQRRAGTTTMHMYEHIILADMTGRKRSSILASLQNNVPTGRVLLSGKLNLSDLPLIPDLQQKFVRYAVMVDLVQVEERERYLKQVYSIHGAHGSFNTLLKIWSHFLLRELLVRDADCDRLRQYCADHCWYESTESISESFAEEIWRKLDTMFLAACQQPDQISDLVQRWVEENFEPTISLSSVAKALFLNDSYLSRTFKAETGRRFVDYLIDVRIERAKKLLEQDNLTVDEVAATVGYTNKQFFSRTFKERTGQTVADYMRTNLSLTYN